MSTDESSSDLPHPPHAEDLPFETASLRSMLSDFLDQKVTDDLSGKETKLGNYKWGVYAFFDWENEPIYVGQTCETLRTRIRRHLTNQRTDAVAMNVLDPFEVYSIRVWPMRDLEGTESRDACAKARLNALEYAVFTDAIIRSRFNAILNEKEPVDSGLIEPIPTSYSGVLVSDQVRELRGHGDIRLARRAAILSRLAQVIVERKVNYGLRQSLLTQAKRITWLAEQQSVLHSDDVDVAATDNEELAD